MVANYLEMRQDKKPSCQGHAAPLHLSGEQGLSLTSALLGMLVMMVMVGFVAKAQFHSEQVGRQMLVAHYYQFLGGELSGNSSLATLTPDSAVSSGLIPSGMVNNGQLNADPLGVVPRMVAINNTLFIVSSQAVPKAEIGKLGGLQSFGVSGGLCGASTVCGNSGGNASWSVPVLGAQKGYAYYGFSS
jgi:hypothetical protein